MSKDVSSKEVSSKEVTKPVGDWYVVLDDGETGSNLHVCSVAYLTEDGAEHLFSGGRIWNLEPDELIQKIDLGHIFDFYKESYGSDWEGEMERVNDLAKKASVKDQYDRYVDVELGSNPGRSVSSNCLVCSMHSCVRCTLAGCRWHVPYYLHMFIVLFLKNFIMYQPNSVLETRSTSRPGAPRQAVLEYFKKKAPSYSIQAQSTYWSWLRKRESEALFSTLGDLTGKRALDLGAGTGFYTKELLSRGCREVTAVDVSESMLAHIPTSAKTTPVHCDAVQFRSDKPFDIVICAGLMEFLEEPTDIFHAASQNSCSGTLLGVLAPKRSWLGETYRYFHRQHGICIELFDRQQIESLAQQAGWTSRECLFIAPFSIVLCFGRNNEI